MKEGIAGGGITVATLLGIAFIILKLCKVIAWQWVWVLAPFWIPAAIYGVILVISLFVILAAAWIEQRKGNSR